MPRTVVYPHVVLQKPPKWRSHRDPLTRGGKDKTPHSSILVFNPESEAKLFFQLWLSGHDIEKLRQDIGVPEELLEKWRTDKEHPYLADAARVMGPLRARVLKIFDAMVEKAERKTA